MMLFVQSYTPLEFCSFARLGIFVGRIFIGLRVLCI